MKTDIGRIWTIVVSIEICRIEAKLKKQDLARQAGISGALYSQVLDRAQKGKKLHYPTISRLVEALRGRDLSQSLHEKLDDVARHKDDPQVFGHRQRRQQA